jgi:uncharacterized membrane protein YoaK (UPF0700 family)
MPGAIESNAANDSAELVRFEQRLPPLLSVIAGMVDVIGFLSLGLFTAHITGNLVVIAALLVSGRPPNMAQVLAVPVFVIAVAAVWWIAKALKRRGPALLQPLLLIQFLLLTCVLIFSVIYSGAVNPRGWMSVSIAMIAVSAMACQFALLRLSLPVAPSTAVMTGNLTNTVLSLLDTLSRREPLMEGAKDRLRKTLALVIGFFAGCMVGAAAVLWLGNWAWSLPVVLAGVAVAFGKNRFPTRDATASAPNERKQ